MHCVDQREKQSAVTQIVHIYMYIYTSVIVSAVKIIGYYIFVTKSISCILIVCVFMEPV